MSQQVTNNYGIGFLPLLAIVFIVLKLTGVIAWSWLWVLSPIIAIVAIWLVVFFGLLAFAAYVDYNKRK